MTRLTRCWADESHETTARIFRVASMDEIKTQPSKDYHDLNHIGFCMGEKRVHPAAVGALAPELEKSATELKLKQKLLEFKSTIKIVTFNIRILNRIGQLLALTASVIDHIIGIVCILQEHRYLHSEDIKYHNTGNRWTFILASAWKNSVNAAIRGVSMLISSQALKSLKSIEKIQPSLMATPSKTIISCYSPTNVSDKMDLITFYNKLSFLVCSIPKHDILIIGEDMDAQIGKNVNNKFSLHNSSNRNGEHLTNFTLENYGRTPTQITLKHK